MIEGKSWIFLWEIDLAQDEMHLQLHLLLLSSWSPFLSKVTLWENVLYMGNQMFVCTPHGTIPFMFFFWSDHSFYVQYNMFGLSNSCHQQNSKDSRIFVYVGGGIVRLDSAHDREINAPLWLDYFLANEAVLRQQRLYGHSPTRLLLCPKFYYKPKHNISRCITHLKNSKQHII